MTTRRHGLLTGQRFCFAVTANVIAVILRLRFGLEGGAPMRLREVGTVLGLTHERVRQLEQQTIRRLIAELADSASIGSAGFDEML